MDLMSGSYSFEVLQKKYGNFMIPAAKLKIGGSNLLELTGVMVENMRITLSLKSAGCAYFYVTSGYDYKNGSFDSALKSKVTLGKEVSVEMGYGSTLVKNNAKFSEGEIVNIGTLEFLAPFPCDKLDKTRIKLINMRAGNRNLPALDFTVELAK